MRYNGMMYDITYLLTENFCWGERGAAAVGYRVIGFFSQLIKATSLRSSIFKPGQRRCNRRRRRRFYFLSRRRPPTSRIKVPPPAWWHCAVRVLLLLVFSHLPGFADSVAWYLGVRRLAARLGTLSTPLLPPEFCLTLRSHHCCQMGTAIKHPVADRVKPSVCNFWHPGTLTLKECPDAKNYK